MKNTLYLILAVFALVLTAGFATALPATYPSTVTGTIFQNDGVTPVNGAAVDVTCTHAGTPTTLHTTSINDGSYFVVFDNQGLCDFNDALLVKATSGSAAGTNTGNMCNAANSDDDGCFIPVALIDVTIPEFGLLGAMIIVIAGLGIIAYKRN
jgi:hypothetical protein